MAHEVCPGVNTSLVGWVCVAKRRRGGMAAALHLCLALDTCWREAVMTANSTASVEVPMAGTYRVDPQRSKVSYSGRHMFGLGVVHATFTLTSGELRVADPLTASTVAMTLDANSFSSNNARRDKDVRSAALLDVATYPEITFAANSLRLDGDQWLAAGTVTAHGKTVPVEVAIDQLTRNGEEMRVHGQAKHLDRYAFGVVKPRAWWGVSSTWTLTCTRSGVVPPGRWRGAPSSSKRWPAPDRLRTNRAGHG